MKLSMPRGLFRKYLVFLLLLVGGVLSVSSAVELYFSYQEAKQSIVRLERTKALAAASEIERYLGQILQHLRGTMQGAIDVSALGTAGTGTQAGGHSRAAALAEQREIDFLRLLRNVPAIKEVRHLDLAGKEQLRTSRLALDAVNSGQDFADSPEFLGAKAKKTYFSPAYFRNETEPFITMAVAPDETAAEVTAAEVNIRAIWDVVTRIGTGRAGNAYVVDSNDQLIAHPDLQARAGEARPLQRAAGQGGPGATRRRRAGRAGVHDCRGPAGRPGARRACGDSGARLARIHRAPVEDTFAPLRAATARSVVVLALGLLLAMLASVALARRMVAPIRRLQEGAARVGKGELDHRIDIRTGDELQALADEFNHTTARLQDSQNNLEQKVEERTAELTESLEQQTATSEVLRVISSSPTDTQPVFDMIARRAMQLCDSQFCAVFRFDGELIHLVAHHGLSPEGAVAYERNFPLPPSRKTAIGRAIQDRTFAQIPDIEADPEYGARSVARAVTFRSILAVPLLRDGRPIGGIAVSRASVGTFPAKHIDLLHTFADQAVIAIENVRVFQELEARTEALTRSVEEMRALGEVGQAVSSTLDLETVLVTIITHAVELSKADAGGTIYEFDEADRSVRAAGQSWRERRLWSRILRESRIRLGETSVGMCAERPEPLPDSGRRRWRKTPVRDLLLREGVRAVLAVPLLREERVIGALVIRRKVAGEFSPSVVTLLQTFAGQSVLAIQNARLFQRDRGKEPAARGGEPAEVAVPRQHVARAAHAAERDHRRDRDAARGRAST